MCIIRIGLEKWHAYVVLFFQHPELSQKEYILHIKELTHRKKCLFCIVGDFYLIFFGAFFKAAPSAALMFIDRKYRPQSQILQLALLNMVTPRIMKSILDNDNLGNNNTEV